MCNVIVLRKFEIAQIYLALVTFSGNIAQFYSLTIKCFYSILFYAKEQSPIYNVLQKFLGFNLHVNYIVYKCFNTQMHIPPSKPRLF